jgi:hypothetical protein
MEQRALFLAMASIPSEKEEAFNRWYNEDHFQKAIKAPGQLSGRRYKILEAGGVNLHSKMERAEAFRYMAIYEYENWGKNEAYIKSAQFQKQVAEFTAAWPESERFWIRAIQIYP